jgi:hypothetical protein
MNLREVYCRIETPVDLEALFPVCILHDQARSQTMNTVAVAASSACAWTYIVYILI